jgi:predicted amidohydrolase YtcJ
MRVGRYDDQALNGRQALEGYTTGAALTGGGDDRLGRLAPGYLADITVMAADPVDTDPTRWSRRQRR